MLFDVVVRNELTGEVEKVRLSTSCSQEAQVGALVHLFKSQGWRKAVAAQPEPALVGNDVE